MKINWRSVEFRFGWNWNWTLKRSNQNCDKVKFLLPTICLLVRPKFELFRLRSSSDDKVVLAKSTSGLLVTLASFFISSLLVAVRLLADLLEWAIWANASRTMIEASKLYFIAKDIFSFFLFLYYSTRRLGNESVWTNEFYLKIKVKVGDKNEKSIFSASLNEAREEATLIPRDALNRMKPHENDQPNNDASSSANKRGEKSEEWWTNWDFRHLST